MVSAIKAPRRTIASLKLSPHKVSVLISVAQAIVKGMTGNPAFPNPVPTLAEVTAATSDPQAAETAALARTKGAVATRNEKRAVLVGLLQHLRAYVQGTADASPENATSIIEGAGMAVRKLPVHPPRVFAAHPGHVSGTALVVAASAARRAAYDWSYSIDGGKTWLGMAPTLPARTSDSGLAVGSSAQFRYRAVTKAGESDWSAPLSFIVK